jgi:hypothetical protein
MGLTAAILFFVLLLPVVPVWPQTAGNQQPAVPAQTRPCPANVNCATPGSTPQQESKQRDSADKNQKSDERQTNRIMWVVPNFAAVSAGKQLPRLTTHDKFALASRDCLDYSGFTWTAILAAQTYAANSDPELGRGIAAYGRYFWRTFADGVSGSYFTEAIVPSLMHEDPRYYTLGSGGFWRRAEYAVSRAVVTKTDSGGSGFNWSEVGGNALVAGLSNAYYPPQERGFYQTVRDWGRADGVGGS